MHSQLDGPVLVGGVELPGRLFLAPVAGYSDAAFRSLCASYGCDLTYTEMVSSEALTRDARRSLELLARAENDERLAVQLFGSDPDRLAASCEIVAPYKPVLIDLNCGCPVPKIVKTGAGSALMRDPRRIGAIVRAMRAASPVPVTVKIRLGWDAGSITYREAALAACDAGAAAVCLHARTKVQGYAGEADWAALADLKRLLFERFPEVPVFGSGDLFGPDAARRMFEETGCDAAMYARGAMGRPWIFKEARLALAGRDPEPISPGERAEIALRHLALARRFLGDETAFRELRKHFAAYTKGLLGGAELRREATAASCEAEYESRAARMAAATLAS